MSIGHVFFMLRQLPFKVNPMNPFPATRLTPPFPLPHNGLMRVITGKAKGRKLKGPKGPETRATSDKVKGALFSILGDRVRDARVLELFAGTGAIGIEALSRGAARVDFVETDKATAAILEQNLSTCGFHDRAEVHPMDAFRFLKKGPRAAEGPAGGPYDIIFADPPYHAWQLKKLLPLLGQGVMISPDGLLVLEHFHKVGLPDRIGALQALRSYAYGDTILTVYHKA